MYDCLDRILGSSYLEDLRRTHRNAKHWLRRCDEEKELFMRSCLGPDYEDEVAEKGFDRAFDELKKDVGDIARRAEAEMRVIPMIRAGYVKIPHPDSMLGMMEYEDIIDDEVAENTI